MLYLIYPSTYISMRSLGKQPNSSKYRFIIVIEASKVCVWLYQTACSGGIFNPHVLEYFTRVNINTGSVNYRCSVKL